MGNQQEFDLLSENPIARAKDPESSHAAAAEITSSGKRAAQQHAVLAAVKTRPGLTSFELSLKMPPSFDRYAVARRLPELRDAKLVKTGESRQCRVSGRKAMTWWPA